MGLTRVTTKLTSIAEPQRNLTRLYSSWIQGQPIAWRRQTNWKNGDSAERQDGLRIGRRYRPRILVRVGIEFMGETTAGRVVFGEPGMEPLLGVTALESVGIMVDPANKTLKRLPAIPLK